MISLHANIHLELFVEYLMLFFSLPKCKHTKEKLLMFWELRVNLRSAGS